MDDPTPQSPEPRTSTPADSTALLSAILESLPFRLVAHDLEGRCVLQNQVSISDFGSVVGRPVVELPLPRPIIDRWLAERQRALAGEVVWGEQDLPIGQEIRTYRYLIAPIRAGGAVRGTVGLDIDITEQRRAEQALRETHQRLHERQAELAHLDRLGTMGQMAAELAHELSQPLYAISNFGEACLELAGRPEIERDELRRWLTQIVQQARRGGDVLKRITQFVRKGDLHRQVVDVNECVRSALALLDLELRRNAVDVRLELARGSLDVAGDALLLEQVMVNLIRNALEAMDAVAAEKQLLTVRTFAQSAEIGVSISDTGPGLPPEINKLFASYFTTKPHGAGLGLAICRSTIEAHHGRIWAEVNPTGGATFQFILPATQAEPPAAIQTESAE